MRKNGFLFVAMLFVALSLGFASCDNNKGNNPDDPTTGNDSGKENNPTIVPTCTDYVDLGLSVKWATCNVGASSPEEFGCYFAWGETTPKTTYDWSTYKWDNGSYLLTKYCIDSDYGTVDNKTVLDPEDDAAAVNMGSNWRLPTVEELQELIDECTWTWTYNYNNTGVAGQIVTSKTNDNSIFLPATGYRSNSDLNHAGGFGGIWSSSLTSDNSYLADNLNIYSDGVEFGYEFSRCIGLSVRGVLR